MAAEAANDKDKKVENGAKQKEGAPATREIDIVGPLTFWIIMLVVGVLLDVILAPISGSVGQSGIQSFLTTIAGYILFLPGSIILPLIVSIWIGERVGANKNKVKAAVTLGEVNAAYTGLIYVIAIFIIYLLVRYITPTFLNTITLTSFIEYVVVVPVVIVVILIPFIAALSAARHSNIA